MTTLLDIRAGWDKAARDDAMFNILTDPDKTGGRWVPDEFFAHGQAEIDNVMDRLDKGDGLLPRWPARALDFGCGVGRLTNALAHYFKRVDGVDISPEMVTRAKLHNRHPSRVAYHLNTNRLPFRAGAFNFVYSMIVLQHMPTDLAKGYVAEFVRVLKPEGVTVFQLPQGIELSHPQPHLSMWGAHPADVEEWLDQAGAMLVRRELSYASGDGFPGWEYTAVKR